MNKEINVWLITHLTNLIKDTSLIFVKISSIIGLHSLSVVFSHKEGSCHLKKNTFKKLPKVKNIKDFQHILTINSQYVKVFAIIHILTLTNKIL